VLEWRPVDLHVVWWTVQVEFAAWGAVLAVYAKGVTAESVLIAMGASSCDATETTAGGCIEAV